VDYTQPITNGPTSVGFDTYFGIAASLDMVPYCYIENDRVTANPTEEMKLAMNAGPGKNGFTREGPGAPGFRGEDVLPTFTKRAMEIIQQPRHSQRTLLPLPAAELAAHAHPAEREVARQKRHQPVCRLRHGDR